MGRCILSICVFCYMWNLFGVTVFHWFIVNCGLRGRCILSICAFCYRWNLYGIMVFHRSIGNWRFWGRCILSICAFSDMWNLFGVMVFHRSIFNWIDWEMYPQYMYILWHVKLIWCEGYSKGLLLLWWGVDICSVYVHSLAC